MGYVRLDRARPPVRSNTSVTFAVIATGVVAYAVMQSLVTPVLPTLQRELHTSQNTVTWVLTANLLSASIFTPIFGRVGDKVGKKKMFVWALVALAVGSLIGGLATSINLLIVARVIQGVGGGVLPLAFGIIRDEFPAEKVGGAVGFVAALTAVGGGLGIVLAGPIVDALGYHCLFWIPMVIVTVAAVIAHFVIPESRCGWMGPSASWAPCCCRAGWWRCSSESARDRCGGGPPPHPWPVRAGDRHRRHLVLRRSPLAGPADRHAHDEAAGGLDHEPGGVPLRNRDVRLVRLHPRVRRRRPPSQGYGFAASITQSGLFLLPLTVVMFIFGLVSGRLSARFGAKLVLLAGRCDQRRRLPDARLRPPETVGGLRSPQPSSASPWDSASPRCPT